jgi:hypothetical protein
MPLFDKNGKGVNAVHLARRLKANQNLEWEAWVHTNDGKKIRGRLITVRRSKLATEYARKKLQQEASKKQKIRQKNLWVSSGSGSLPSE